MGASMTAAELGTLERGDWVKFIGGPTDPRIQGMESFTVGKKYTFQYIYGPYQGGNSGWYFSVDCYCRSLSVNNSQDQKFRVSEEEAKELLETVASYFELIKRRHEELQSNYLQGRIKRTISDVQKALNKDILRNKNYVDDLMKEIPTHDLINFTKQLTPEQQVVLKFLYSYTDIKDLAKFFKQEEQ